jgi:hypothetical protein
VNTLLTKTARAPWSLPDKRYPPNLSYSSKNPNLPMQPLLHAYEWEQVQPQLLDTNDQPISAAPVGVYAIVNPRTVNPFEHPRYRGR